MALCNRIFFVMLNDRIDKFHSFEKDRLHIIETDIIPYFFQGFDKILNSLKVTIIESFFQETQGTKLQELRSGESAGCALDTNVLCSIFQITLKKESNILRIKSE
jgi:hypothetical protein